MPVEPATPFGSDAASLAKQQSAAEQIGPDPPGYSKREFCLVWLCLQNSRDGDGCKVIGAADANSSPFSLRAKQAKQVLF